MRDSLIRNTETTTVNLLATAMDAITPAKKETVAGMDYNPETKVITLTPKQRRRADRKAVRLRKKG